MNLESNIAAFTNMFGENNAHIVFPFAIVDWQSKEDRNNFLNELLSLNDNQRIGE